MKFPPGPSGYEHDGSDGMPWLQTLILWVGCIGLVVLTLPAITVIVVGVVGSLMGLR